MIMLPLPIPYEQMQQQRAEKYATPFASRESIFAPQFPTIDLFAYTIMFNICNQMRASSVTFNSFVLFIDTHTTHTESERIVIVS